MFGEKLFLSFCVVVVVVVVVAAAAVVPCRSDFQ